MHIFGFNILSALVILYIIYISFKFLFRSRKRKINSPEIANTSILLSYFSHGSKLQHIKTGKLGKGFRYTALLANNTYSIEGGPESAIIYKVQLPFATTVHLLGIPKNTNAVQLDPTQSDGLMERVELEGNYNDSFNLFCEEGMQADTRYVLDPKAMVFTLDFCQSQSWEIVGNELFFVVSSGMKTAKNDKTSLFKDAELFIEEIRPAVERPLSPKEIELLTPYGKDYRTDLACPLCSQTMVNEETYYHCPQGHGVLLSGGQLGQLMRGSLKPKTGANNPLKHTKDLLCPSCKHKMAKIAYAGSKLQIDSCSNCPYRWLDAGEYQK